MRLGSFLLSGFYPAPQVCGRSMIAGVGRSSKSPVPASLAYLRRILPTLRSLVMLTLVLALVPLALAQRGTGGAVRSGSPAHMSLPHHLPAAGSVFGSERGRGRFDRRAGPYSYYSLPFPFFDDAVDADDLYAAGYPVAAPLPPFVPPSEFSGYGGPARLENSQSTEPSQPLMIELQNGRYTQVSSTAIDGEAAPLNSVADDARTSRPVDQSPMIAASAANKMAPVVLIFRDGHSEQVHEYTIANGTLYARGDYYTDGYWNKQIALASLNLTETVRANASRNVQFAVPSSPNEVIARF